MFIYFSVTNSQASGSSPHCHSTLVFFCCYAELWMKVIVEYVSSTMVTNRAFANDAATLAELLEVLVMPLRNYSKRQSI